MSCSLLSSFILRIFLQYYFLAKLINRLSHNLWTMFQILCIKQLLRYITWKFQNSPIVDLILSLFLYTRKVYEDLEFGWSYIKSSNYLKDKWRNSDLSINLLKTFLSIFIDLKNEYILIFAPTWNQNCNLR